MSNLVSLTTTLALAALIGCSSPDESNTSTTSSTTAGQSAAQDKAPTQNPKAPDVAQPDKSDKPPVPMNAEEGQSTAMPPAPGDWADGDTIPSGKDGVPAIQILKVHNNGAGDPCGLGKSATLKYKAMLANGKVIDPGRQPFTFKVGSGRAIKGWDVVVSKMRVGDSFTILLPQDLAYGARKGDLKFDMELLSVK